MGKRKDRESNSEEARLSSPKKKHKHKHKKHKRRKEAAEDDTPRKEKKKDRVKSKDREKHHEPEERSLKIKIKLGGQTLTTKQLPTIVPVITSEEEEDVEIENEVEEIAELSDKSYQQSIQEGSEQEEGKKKERASDHEEEAWLNALEAGELDDYGRLKQEKDISMMTARQRAMHGHEIEGENQLLELPTEIRRKDEDSEEAQKKRKKRAQKRKQQMQKQIEDNKAQTVKKLLERETSKAKKDEEKARRQKAEKPNIRYLSGKYGFSLSYPNGTDFPFQGQKSTKQVKPKEKCKAQGCTNDKKYNCSSNNIPVCSLECYQLVKTLPAIEQPIV